MTGAEAALAEDEDLTSSSITSYTVNVRNFLDYVYKARTAMMDFSSPFNSRETPVIVPYEITPRTVYNRKISP